MISSQMLDLLSLMSLESVLGNFQHLKRTQGGVGGRKNLDFRSLQHPDMNTSELKATRFHLKGPVWIFIVILIIRHHELQTAIVA